jgi:hypothetical protein
MCVVEALIGAALGRYGVEVYATMQSGCPAPRDQTNRIRHFYPINDDLRITIDYPIWTRVRHWLLLSGGPRALTIALISPILCCVGHEGYIRVTSSINEGGECK